MPEIQIIPQAPDSFGQGVQAVNQVGQAFMQALAFKKSLEKEDLENKLLTQQLQQTEHMAPLQDALIQSRIEETGARIEALHRGMDLDEAKFDYSTYDDDRKFTLSKQLADEELASRGVDRRTKEKMAPILQQQAKLGLDQTQAQIQALKDDKMFKIAAMGQQQQEFAARQQQAEIQNTVHVLSTYENADVEKQKAMLNSPTLGKYLQGMPVGTGDVSKVINQKLVDVLKDPELGPQVGGQLLAARVNELAGKPDKAEEMANLMEQLNNNFNAKSKKATLGEAMTGFLKKQNGGGKQPVGQPTASAGGTDTQPELGTVEQVVGDFTKAFETASKQKDVTTLDGGSFEKSPFDRDILRKVTQTWFDATREKKDGVSGAINKFVSGKPEQYKRTASTEQINIGNELIRQMVNSPDPRQVGAAFIQTPFYKKLTEDQRKRLADIGMMLTTPTK